LITYVEDGGGLKRREKSRTGRTAGWRAKFKHKEEKNRPGDLTGRESAMGGEVTSTAYRGLGESSLRCSRGKSRRGELFHYLVALSVVSY